MSVIKDFQDLEWRAIRLAQALAGIASLVDHEDARMPEISIDGDGLAALMSILHAEAVAVSAAIPTVCAPPALQSRTA